MTKRNWSGPREKVEAEGNRCRICGASPAEAAHIIPRSRVSPGPGENPLNIVPLDRKCHAAFDGLRLDILPYLSRGEQSYAVELVGLIEAVRRLTGRRDDAMSAAVDAIKDREGAL